MSTYTVYRLADGAVVKHVTCPASQIDRNTPQGCAALEGTVDPVRHRVDPETRALVELPRQPVNDDVHVAALARETIARIEAGQVRAIREALLGDPTAIERLREQEPEIAAARAVLQRSRP